MSDETAVRKVVESWAKAVEAGDRKAILANHNDFLMYDFADTVRGLEAYAKTWDFFYGKARGPIVYHIGDMQVSAGNKVAFVSCQVHCDGTSAGALEFRLTTGLQKSGDDWTIVHEHHSVPTVEERFLGTAIRRGGGAVGQALPEPDARTVGDRDQADSELKPSADQ